MNKINGIDVSECSYYNKDNEPYCCEVWDNECEAQNCYFKQLKRLQKENEKLKEKIKSEKYIKENALQEATKYSMKCGEFRQALKNIRTYINQECENKQCPQTCANCFMGNVLIKVNEVLNDRD